MMNLAHHPKLSQLARNLQIPESGDSLRELREHAIKRVQRMLDEWSGVATLEDLRLLVSDRLSVKCQGRSESFPRGRRKRGPPLSW